MKTLDTLIDEALEFGLDLETAQKIAPAMLYYVNHPDGMQALIEREPEVAARLPSIRKH